ncbi:MAG: SRPBCC family protein [Bacteroidia bacterium]|nr:SRPBCC family protein [Bacteroidia bacterium]
MKVLKYIFFFVVALIVLFFLVGLIKPTINYGAEITVNKSAKEAWAVSKDESKYDQWLEGFKSIELIEGEQDQLGSKYKVIVNPGEGQADFEMIQTLVDYKDYEYVVLHFDSEFMDFEQKISHTESDGITTIKSDSNVKAKGLVMKSMFAIMEMFGGAFTKQETKNFNALKKLIEENTTDYFPEPVEAVTEEVNVESADQ